MKLWLIEVDDASGKNISKKIFENETEAKSYFQSQVVNTSHNVRLYTPMEED